MIELPKRTAAEGFWMLDPFSVNGGF